MALYNNCDVNIHGGSSTVVAGDQIIHNYLKRSGVAAVVLAIPVLSLVLKR